MADTITKASDYELLRDYQALSYRLLETGNPERRAEIDKTLDSYARELWRRNWGWSGASLK